MNRLIAFASIWLNNYFICMKRLQLPRSNMTYIGQLLSTTSHNESPQSRVAEQAHASRAIGENKQLKKFSEYYRDIPLVQVSAFCRYLDNF